MWICNLCTVASIKDLTKKYSRILKSRLIFASAGKSTLESQTKCYSVVLVKVRICNRQEIGLVRQNVICI